MSLYDKKIVYFDYLEDGEKVRNAGFAKVITDEQELRFQLNIKGLPKTDTLNCKLYFVWNNKEVTVDNVFLKSGECIYSRGITRKEMKEQNLEYSGLLGMKIRVAEDRWVQAIWKKAIPIIEETEEEITQSQKVTQPQEQIEFQKQSQTQEQPQEIQQASCIKSPIRTMATELEEKKCLEIADDKWKQLEQMYPSVHPFGDKRTYLSIEPKDFIILTRENQQLVNNSFLLHGFYNYHHILLGKIKKSGEEEFYLGVPGVYYDREKMVAVMFGFESFECAREPAETGGFGYYMKKVNI